MAKPIVSLLASDGLTGNGSGACALWGRGYRHDRRQRGRPRGSTGRHRGWFGRTCPELPCLPADLRRPLEDLTYGVRDAAGALGAAAAAARQTAVRPRHRSREPGGLGAGATAVLAPVVGLCGTRRGAPFYVEFVEGPILRGLAEARSARRGRPPRDRRARRRHPGRDPRRRPRRGGPRDWGARRTSPASCRWHGQWEKSRPVSCRRSMRCMSVSRRASRAGPATIVHGDTGWTT